MRGYKGKRLDTEEKKTVVFAVVLTVAIFMSVFGLAWYFNWG